MDQFRQVGEALGGIKSLMVLKEDIQINRKQCLLLFDIFNLAYDTISEEIRQNLRLEEKNIKWKALENPLKELHRIFKEGETYIKSCLEVKDNWWGKAIAFHQSKECLEFHIHNLLFCFAIVVEAIESAGEIACVDQDDMQKRRIMLMKKYEGDWNDPKLFQWRYGKQYLVSREICNRLDSSWREDRWILLEAIKERKNSTVSNHLKNEQRLAELMIHKLNGSKQNGKLFPGCTLTASKDYTVKRRLGSGGSHCKEIQWFGESFALKNFYGEVNEDLSSEISKVLSLSHPNILQYHCILHDEDKKEGFLVMEAMNKSLSTFVKENSGQRKRFTISLPSAVDIMLQVARGMEYLHSQKIYHGDLNPSNVLLKPRYPTSEGYFYAKINGYSFTNSMKYNSKRNVANQGTEEPIIWYAPEVLSELERGSKKVIHKYTEKADIYSYGMLCFEILTGKVPFEEGHLQDDKTGRNIRAGERPLFPFTTPKFLVNLTRKCWQAESSNRPSFSAICRILRHIKKCLVINPDLGQPESAPPIVDYCDIEVGYSKLFPAGWKLDFEPISQVPFQMFAYRLVEKEKISANLNKVWDLARDGQSGWGPSSVDGGNNGGAGEDSFFKATDRRSVCSESPTTMAMSKPKADQRSVCSDTPWRRVLSMTAVENKFACSEFSWRKINDNSSTVGSKTIERRNSFAAPAMVDQTSEASDAIERNESSDILIPGAGENSQTDNSPPSEKNIAVSEMGEKNVTRNVAGDEGQTQKQKGTLSRALSEAKFTSLGEQKKSRLSRTMSDLSIKKKDQMMPSAFDSMGSSVIFEIPEKKSLLSSKETDKKSGYYETGDGKLSLRKKKVDSEAVKGGLVKAKLESPGSSPLRTFKESLKLPGKTNLRVTSPTGISKESSSSKFSALVGFTESPSSSPLRSFKQTSKSRGSGGAANSPGASPMRTFREASKESGLGMTNSSSSRSGSSSPLRTYKGSSKTSPKSSALKPDGRV